MSDRAQAPPVTVSTGDAPSAAQAPEVPGSDGRVPFRTYSLIATIGVVPLVLMVLALLVFQFRNEHRALLEELQGQAIEHNILLSNVIKTVEDHVWRLGAWSEIYALSDDQQVACPSPRRRCPPAVRWRRGAVRAQLRGARRCSGGLLAGRKSDPAHAAVA